MSFIGSAFLSRFSDIVNCRLFFLCFMSKNHLWVSTYNIWLSESGFPHSIWCFLAPFTSVKFSRCHYFLLCSSLLGKFLLPVLQFRGIKVVRDMTMMLLWKYVPVHMSKCPCGMIEHTLDIYPKLELLSLEEGHFLIFWEITTLPSKGVVPAFTPTSNALPHIFFSISSYRCFRFWPFWQV